MVVKTNSAGYPKKELKQAMVKRGDIKCLRTTIDGQTMWATAHMDKQPLTLVHNCDTILPGPARYRTFCRYVKETKQVKRATFRLDQPSVAATYRDKFWNVDRFNKLSLGPDSL